MSRSIRVLHIGLSDNLGGPEVFVHNMYEHLDKSEVSFDFLDCYKRGMPYSEEYLENGSNIYTVTPRHENPIKNRKQIQEIFFSQSYDFIHFHMMSFAWFEPILICSSIEKTKLIAHSHLAGFSEATPKKFILEHEIGKKLTKHCKYLKLACGQAAGEWLFKDASFTIIENGIDQDKYLYNDDARMQIRSSLGIENEFVVGHVGNFSHQKNYPKLISIFSELKKKIPNAKLLLVGDYSKYFDQAYLQNVIKKDSSIILTGMVVNVSDYYSAMDIFLFPSLNEGFSIALIEAQTANLPCFVSNRVASENDINNSMHFFSPYDADKKIVQDMIETGIEFVDRRKNAPNKKYDAQYSAKKLLFFYENNLPRQEEWYK